MSIANGTGMLDDKRTDDSTTFMIWETLLDFDFDKK